MNNSAQITLGELIIFLEGLAPTFAIKGLGMLDSYRRYPQQLSFDPTNSTVTAKELLKACNDAKSGAFEGYKGGDYLMGDDTPLWVAGYGEVGPQLTGINNDGSIETRDEPR